MRWLSLTPYAFLILSLITLAANLKRGVDLREAFVLPLLLLGLGLLAWTVWMVFNS